MVYPNVPARRAQFSGASLVAVVTAVVSFFLSAGWGMLLAGVAIIAGVIGFALAIAPGVRGGIASILSIIGGGGAVVVALIKLVVR